MDKDITVIDTKVFVMHAKMKYKSVEGIKCAAMEWNASLDIVEWLSPEEPKAEDVEGTNRNVTPAFAVQTFMDIRFVNSYFKRARIARYRKEAWDIR